MAWFHARWHHTHTHTRCSDGNKRSWNEGTKDELQADRMYGSQRCSTTWKLSIGDTKTKQDRQIWISGTKDVKWDTKMRKRIGIAKGVFQNLNKILKTRKIALETIKSVLNYYVISVLLVTVNVGQCSRRWSKDLRL